MINRLELDIDRALFQGHVDGWVAPFYFDERPLHGLAGWLDWRFDGAISAHLAAGRIRGDEAECVYLPLTKGAKLFHIILIGGGKRPASKSRGAVPKKCLEKVSEALSKLRLQKMGLSIADFHAHEDADAFQKPFKEVPIWIIH